MLLKCSLSLNRLSCTVFSSMHLWMITNRLELSKLKSLKLRYDTSSPLKLRYDTSSPQSNVDSLVPMLQHIIERSTSLTHLDLSEFEVQTKNNALQCLKSIRPELDILTPDS